MHHLPHRPVEHDDEGTVQPPLGLSVPHLLQAHREDDNMHRNLLKDSTLTATSVQPHVNDLQMVLRDEGILDTENSKDQVDELMADIPAFVSQGRLQHVGPQLMGSRSVGVHLGHVQLEDVHDSQNSTAASGNWSEGVHHGQHMDVLDSHHPVLISACGNVGPELVSQGRQQHDGPQLVGSGSVGVHLGQFEDVPDSQNSAAEHANWDVGVHHGQHEDVLDSQHPVVISACRNVGIHQVQHEDVPVSRHQVAADAFSSVSVHHGQLEEVCDSQHPKAASGIAGVHQGQSGGHGVSYSQHSGALRQVAASHLPEKINSLNGNGQCKESENVNCLNLNPDAVPFKNREPGLLHRGVLVPDLNSDWEHVQRVALGGIGDCGVVDTEPWQMGLGTGIKPSKHDADKQELSKTGSVLPFQLTDDIPGLLGIAPKQVHRVGGLPDLVVKLPCGNNFTDKVIPQPDHLLVPDTCFTPDYFVALHNIVSAPGYRGDGTAYPAYTPNHIGARIQLPHVKLKIGRWRHHLIGYENVELVQHLEFGFPLGLNDLPDLKSSTRNHGSAYQWYSHVDKFICNEVLEGGMTGPFKLAPWWNTVVSPVMTAHKKPVSRRTVFDATFGEKSLNNSTPSDLYMGQPTHYTFPKIEDYKEMILKSGRGAYMWKRDLSRFFLQLPLDPSEFHRVAVVWRGFFFFFLGLAFGLRHSGLNGQRVTDAACWVLKRLGLESGSGRPFQVCNYVDDLGGVEGKKSRAEEAYKKCGELLVDLGLEESHKKAEPPTTRITFLGVQFDSMTMTMSVPPAKLSELKAEIRLWIRRTTICKKELQSLLGKMFWVAKCVKYARVFMGRLLAQLRTMSHVKDNKKVKLQEEACKDILWWAQYLEHYNGVNMIVNDNPIPLSYDQLLDSPHDICAGDATPTGGGAWHGREYWCGELPAHLKDPQIPIHLKEFWVVIVSAKLWGDTWTGRCIVIYCDNDSVCDTIQYKKPRDPALLCLLREFLYVVVTKKFFPVLRKIGTHENKLADFISRRFDQKAAAKIFAESGLHEMQLVKPSATFFNLSEKW